MKVQIEDNLYIESDTFGFQVTKYSAYTNKKGKEVESRKSLGNYTTVEGCAHYIATKLKIKESTATTLHELIKDVVRIEQYIKDKINF